MQKYFKKAAEDGKAGTVLPETGKEAGREPAEKDSKTDFGALPRCPDHYTFEDGM